MRKVNLPIETGARCLDGSPSAFYIRKGWGDGVNKFIYHFSG